MQNQIQTELNLVADRITSGGAYIGAVRGSARRTLIIAAVLVSAVASGWPLACSTRDRVILAGFWFEAVSYDSTEAMVGPLGGPLTVADLRTIEEVARSEIVRVFAPLRITFIADRRATYRVRVVQDLRNLRAPWAPGPAAESRSVPGLGGEGAVSFRMIVSNAVAYAEAADRPAIITAIGKGIERAAIHEFAHQLLGTAALHSPDRASYEYESAARREQYYGELHWDVAWPVLQRRVGLR